MTGERLRVLCAQITENEGERASSWPLSKAFVEDLALVLQIEPAWLSELKPWEIYSRIYPQLVEFEPKIDPTAQIKSGVTIDGSVSIGANSVVYENTVLRGSVVIGDGVEIGGNSLIRDSVVMNGVRIGANVDIGRSILGTGSKTFSKIADGILGNRSWVAGNVTCSNLRLDEEEILIITKGAIIHTGLYRLGAIIGDEVKIGSASMLYPGVLVGRGSVVLPGSIIDCNLPEGVIVRPVQTVQLTEIPDGF